jgi:hypothetical protein
MCFAVWFGVRCMRHWRRSIKSKNRYTKRERDADTDTEKERERKLWGQWSFEECDWMCCRVWRSLALPIPEKEKESCGDNGVLKSAIQCAVGFGAHLCFLFLCNSFPFFRVWCFARTVALAGIANLCYKTFPARHSWEHCGFLGRWGKFKNKGTFSRVHEERKRTALSLSLSLALSAFFRVRCLEKFPRT